MSARGVSTDTLLRRYAQWAPTNFDCKGAFLHEEEENYGTWYVSPCLQTRDSTALEHANYRAVLDALEGVDPERVDHEERRFGHWGPGWYEIILARPDTAAARALEDCARALADYPVLDDELHSRLELEERDATWSACYARDVERALAKSLRADNPDWPEAEDALENVNWDDLRDLVERVMDRENLYWTHDDSGAGIDVERVVRAIGWDELESLPGFKTPDEEPAEKPAE